LTEADPDVLTGVAEWRSSNPKDTGEREEGINSWGQHLQWYCKNQKKRV